MVMISFHACPLAGTGGRFNLILCFTHDGRTVPALMKDEGAWVMKEGSP